MSSASVMNRIVIGASPSLVWDVLIDTRRYAEWNPRLVRVDGSFAAGAVVTLHYVQEQRFIPGRFVVDVSTFKEGRTLAFSGPQNATRALLRAVHSFHLEPSADESSTTLVHAEAFAGLLAPMLWPVLGPVVAKNHASVNGALKARVESLQHSTPSRAQ